MPTVELRFSALPGHVRTARLIAAVVARRAGLPESTLDEVRLAVGEACTRAVDLHRQFCPEVPVDVTLTHDHDHFEVVVRDSTPTEGTLGTGRGPLEALEQQASTAHSGSTAGGEAAEAAGQDERLGGGGPSPETTDPYLNGSSEAADAALRPLPPGVGLAVIGGIVDEVDVEADEHGARVRMRWPVPVSLWPGRVRPSGPVD